MLALVIRSSSRASRPSQKNSPHTPETAIRNPKRVPNRKFIACSVLLIGFRASPVSDLTRQGIEREHAADPAEEPDKDVKEIEHWAIPRIDHPNV